MADKTIFAKIIAKEIPAKIVHEDEQCLAFRDISPQAPTHVLIIPKKEVAKLAETDRCDQALLGHLLLTAARIARQEGLDQSGYRVVINNGERAGQTVFHLHLHLLGGRDFSWPPG